MSTTKINYIEMPASDIAATKQFFNDAFGWEYIDYGAITRLSKMPALMVAFTVRL